MLTYIVRYIEEDQLYNIMLEITETQDSVCQCFPFRLQSINVFPDIKMASQSSGFLLPIYFRTFSIFK